jgi:hypothetical protein
VTVDSLIDAIRAAEGGAGPGGAAGDDAEVAVATRLRVMRSLEARARSRHQLIGFATAVAILLGGTVSWALATGQVAALWSPAPALPPSAQPQIAPAIAPQRPARHPAAPQPPAMSIDPRPAQPELQPPEAVPAAPPAPRPVPAPQPPRRAAAAVEVLYRRAHDLHFHGGDPAAALAAWDAYLAAEPDGRFAVEARYNRALGLVRLGRYGEARAALAPFARGEVAPAGYRQAEAEQLVERLARDP